MSEPVKLTEIVGALDVQNDQIFHHLDKETGEIVMFSSEELRAAEEGAPLDRYPDWQQEVIKQAQAVVADTAERFIELPTQFDVHEYTIMERFCLSLADPAISDDMYYAIKGRGAFRRFKDKLYQHGLTDAWYEYRDRAFTEIARDWCEENNIDYV